MNTQQKLTTSSRAIATPPSPIRKLVPLAEAAKRQGVKVYHLNIGQPDIKSPQRFLNALKAYPDKIVAYENSLGNPDLRQALAKYYRSHKIDLSLENIIVTTGASEAIIFALLAVCDSEDECLVFEPFYANYLSFASMAGITLKAISTQAKNGFRLPQEKTIEQKISKKTRALVIINPNNPTGTVYSKKELLTIDKLARHYNLFIIADETYREFVYDSKNHHSLLTIRRNPKNVILVDSLSKRFSLCGARIGCLVSFNQQILEAATKFAQARLSSPTIAQYAATQALKTPKTYFSRVNREYQARRDVLIQELQKIPGIFVMKPKGAFYTVVKLPVKNAEDFARWLLTDFRYQNTTLMLAPAKGFYLSRNLGKNEVRIAYVLNPRALKKATSLLKKALEIYETYPTS